VRGIRGKTYPRRNRKHGNPIRHIKAQKHSVPAYIRQLLNRVEIRRARGVLHLDANRAGVVHTLVVIYLVACPSDGAGLDFTPK
jgi:hypothetical protein